MIIPIAEANQGQRTFALKQMKAAMGNKNEVPMEYIGGTLGISIGPETCVTVVLGQEITKEEAIAAARLYVKHKTEAHSYYALAKEILCEEDEQTTEIKMLRSALERLDHRFRVSRLFLSQR